VIEWTGDTRGNGKAGGWELLHTVIVWAAQEWRKSRRRSIHRVSRSLPRLDSAFQHLDVRKALRLVFRCLTDSARFGGSRSIKDDFLRLRQGPRSELQAGEGYGPVQI
jgi:hypothetical protein